MSMSVTVVKPRAARISLRELKEWKAGLRDNILYLKVSASRVLRIDLDSDNDTGPEFFDLDCEEGRHAGISGLLVEPQPAGTKIIFKSE